MASKDLEEAVTEDITKSLINGVQKAIVSSNEIKLSCERLTRSNKILPKMEDCKSRSRFPKGK